MSVFWLDIMTPLSARRMSNLVNDYGKIFGTGELHPNQILKHGRRIHQSMCNKGSENTYSPQIYKF